MGITTKDLAQMCGVSRTTVHRALSGEGRIHPGTKEMILRVAREYDYRPDLLARGLVKGRTNSIGIVVLDVKNRYFAEMISVIGAEVSRRGYCMNIMLHNNNAALEKEQVTRLAAYHVDGIILSSINEGEDYRSFLEGLDIPVVTADNKITEGIPFVSIDQRQAMREATLCVCRKGYRKLAYVCPYLSSSENENMYVHRERLRGFEDALREFPDIEPCSLADLSYLEEAERLVRGREKVAFVCFADSFALDVMKYLGERGWKPPVDYGITGFDNIDTLDYVAPRLATVSNNVQEVAVTAVDYLFELIESRREQRELQQCTRMLPYTLIPGETI